MDEHDMQVRTLKRVCSANKIKNKIFLNIMHALKKLLLRKVHSLVEKPESVTDLETRHIIMKTATSLCKCAHRHTDSNVLQDWGHTR